MKRFLSLVMALCLMLCLVPLSASADNPPVITEQPRGCDCDIGTPYTLYISAETQDGGKLSYQWYSTTVNDISTIRAIYDVNDASVGAGASYVPEQEVGTVYYCCMVTSTCADGSESFVYSDLVAVTFNAKMFNRFAIEGLTPPAVGEKPDTTVTRATDDPNNFYGYDVVSVKWSPNDKTFKAGVAYTVTVRCRVWDNAHVRSDYFGTINGVPATMPYDFDAGGEITVSYTYPALPEEAEESAEPKESAEPAESAEPDAADNAAEDIEEQEGGSAVIWIIAAVIAAAAAVTAVVVVKKKKK